MAVKVVCPTCKSWLKVATRKIGYRIDCPKCSQALVAVGEGVAHVVDGVPVERPDPHVSYLRLCVLFLVLISLPSVWVPALQYRAERNDEILAAQAKPAPDAGAPAPTEAPKSDPIAVAKLDPLKRSPEEMKSDPKDNPLDPIESTTAPPRPVPKVTPLPPPPPPPVIAKVDPTPPRPEPRPTPKFVPPPPPPKPEKTPAELKVESIFDEIRRFPAASKSQNLGLQALMAGPLPRFGDEIDEYNQTGYTPFGVASGDAERLRAEFPLRAMTYEISLRLAKAAQIPIRDTLASPIDPKLKARIPADQKAPALALLSLQEILDDAQALPRDKEKSKRWLAHFDLAVTRLQARIVYLYEYDNLLALIRTESLPALENGEKSWRVEPCPKVQTKEAAVKDLAKQVAKGWDRIIRDYPNTPWSLVAAREKDGLLGLEWVANKK